MLTQIQHDAISAAQNEALNMSKEDINDFKHVELAWNNAIVYAEQYGHSINAFRNSLTSMFGFQPTWGTRTKETED